MSSPHLDMHTLVASQQANLTFPAIPDYPSDLEWVTAYLVQRMLSHASWAYAYLVWILIGTIYLIYSVARWTGLNNTYVAALWNRWALRRRTWRKKHTLALALRQGQEHRQPLSLPPNAHILAIILLYIGAFLISFIGPDYMAPGSYFWNVKDFPTLKKRSFNLADFYYLQPQFTITKMWYTSGNRTGLIAFALFPLTVLFALKAPPFAIFAIPQFTHICFDKLAFMHRWCAFLVWLLTTLHVVLWCVQLAIDHKAGHNGFHFAWLYTKFRYAWTAYILFTILMIASLPVVRRRRYEAFYFLHIFLVPLTLIFSALHHPPVWWWCWAALALWIGERSYRFVWWLNTNGYLGGVRTTTYRSNQTRLRSQTIQQPQGSPSTPDVLHMHALGQAKGINHLPVLPQVDESLVSQIHHSLSITGSSYTPPPGFVHAELLSGKTIRIRMVTPGFLSWAPGQHFLINIPAISKYTSHPFTVASVCDSKAVSAAGHELIFYIRAKKGWTKKLWETVVGLHQQGLKYPSGDGKLPAYCPLPPRGVLLRAFVDGPFGSAARARWNDHSTVLLIAGGSGVSFALSVLEYMCMCMAGRDGRELGGQAGGLRHRNFKTQRVRFVWLVREFAHIHWCASFLRRCVRMVGSSPEVQIDIFVTNYKPSLQKSLSTPDLSTPRLDTISESPLVPPSPHFVRDGTYSPYTPYSPKFEKGHMPSPSIESVDSDEEDATSDVDLSYYTSEIVEEERGELGHEEHALDLTNFEGDDDSTLPGEAFLNDAVKMEGRVRRSIWKTASLAVSAKHESRDSNNVPFRSSGPIHERPASAAMMSLHPLADAALSRVQLTSPLNVASPIIGGRPHSEIEKASLTPVVTAVPVKSRRGSQSWTPPDSPRPLSALSEFSGDAHSLAALVSEAAARDQFVLELEEGELNDISVVSGHTRAGRPALNKIIADEVERAKGSIIVGCCGPTSLSAVVRKHIAAQIKPSRLLHGDMRGQIDLVSEDFEY